MSSQLQPLIALAYNWIQQNVIHQFIVCHHSMLNIHGALKYQNAWIESAGDYHTCTFFRLLNARQKIGLYTKHIKLNVNTIILFEQQGCEFAYIVFFCLQNHRKSNKISTLCTEKKKKQSGLHVKSHGQFCVVLDVGKKKIGHSWVLNMFMLKDLKTGSNYPSQTCVNVAPTYNQSEEILELQIVVRVAGLVAGCRTLCVRCPYDVRARRTTIMRRCATSSNGLALE